MQAAVAELRGQGISIDLIQDAVPRAFYSSQEGMGKAPYVLKLNSSKYDIGLYPDGKGGYEARTDFWGQHVENVLGAKASSAETREQAKMGKLFQAYALCAAEEQARNQGLMCSRVPGENGAVQLVVTGY